jgi:hypothetical protein
MDIRCTLLVLPIVTACSQDYGISDVKPLIEAPTVGIPVATCHAGPSPVTPPFEEATWFGSGEDATGAEIVEYRWALVEAPQGTAVSLPPGENELPGFMPDLAGDYVASLVVVNEFGDESEPCLATLQAIPAQNLWVEMYWTVANDDMDLHLIRGNGQVDSADDCYYLNCADGQSLPWGGPGDSDNPRLDLDDIPGTGPENINIDQPADEVFTVMVHDYEHGGLFGSVSDYAGDNMVTVNIYIDGAMEYTDTKAISGENQRVGFAVVDWAHGTVTPY